MTPEKLLDYSVKFGVLPFMLYMIVITRQDVRYLQERLENCYEMQIISAKKPFNEKKMLNKMVAILPNELKIKKMKRNA